MTGGNSATDQAGCEQCGGGGVPCSRRPCQVTQVVPQARSTVNDLFALTLRASGKIFFRAPSSLVSMHCQQHRRADRAQEAETPARMTLSKASLSRLDEHIYALQSGGCRFAVIAYTQNVTFMKFDMRVPALTKGIRLWGVSWKEDSGERSLDRMMLDIEKLASMGWPVLLDATDARSQRLPSAMRYAAFHKPTAEDVTTTEWHEMIGNGMHVLQILAALSVALLGSAKIGA